MAKNKKYTNKEIEDLLVEIKDKKPLSSPDDFTKNVSKKISNNDVEITEIPKRNNYLIIGRITAIAASFVLVIGIVTIAILVLNNNKIGPVKENPQIEHSLNGNNEARDTNMLPIENSPKESEDAYYIDKTEASDKIDISLIVDHERSKYSIMGGTTLETDDKRLCETIDLNTVDVIKLKDQIASDIKSGEYKIDDEDLDTIYKILDDYRSGVRKITKINIWITIE